MSRPCGTASEVVLPLDGTPNGPIVFPAGRDYAFIPLSFRDGALIHSSVVDINPGCYCDVTYRITRGGRVPGSSGVETVVEKHFSAAEFLATGRARK